MAVWSVHLWAATIAVVTYFILTAPMSRTIHVLEKNWHYLWIVFLVITSAIASGGLHYGYKYSGGYCFVAQGPYFSFVVFGGRAVAFSIIVVVYVRLYFFFRRNVGSSRSSSTVRQSAEWSINKIMPRKPSATPSQASMPTKRIKPLANTAKWENLALPSNFFQAENEVDDGSASQKQSVDSNTPLEPIKGPIKHSQTSPVDLTSYSLVDAHAPGSETSKTDLVQTEKPLNEKKHDREIQQDEEDEEESVASYLNRVAARLMLLYPTAYLALFTISFINIIWTYARKGPSAHNPYLHAIARWSNSCQGIADLLIYTLVEYRTRQLAKRKTNSLSESARHRLERASQSRRQSMAPEVKPHPKDLDVLSPIFSIAGSPAIGARRGSVTIVEPTKPTEAQDAREGSLHSPRSRSASPS